ncbi:hypothetical protein CYB_1976 [Synechococcus sp. JA-2-3B'a(2-13)]|nr:hypothetical protein CYB_1976 [Synechococcus sp. JA-2-3B'a(2-13)]
MGEGDPFPHPFCMGEELVRVGRMDPLQAGLIRLFYFSGFGDL